jgi:hypothetical protein
MYAVFRREHASKDFMDDPRVINLNFINLNFLNLTIKYFSLTIKLKLM